VEEARGVRQLAELFGRGRDDAFLPVADVDAPQPGKRIDHAAAVDIGQPHALPGFQNARPVLFMAAERNDGVDQVVAINVDKRAVG
jgi:hypothetical protein